jgi:probable HAF family extracellular repeat protein
MSHRHPWIGIGLALLTASAPAQLPVRYEVRNLGTLGVPAFNGIYPSDINRAGQIAGQASPDNTSTSAVLTGADGSRGHVIQGLGGDDSRALAVSDRGRAVGSSALGDGTFHAFATTRDGQAMVDLGTLGGPDSEARGINDLGVIVGWSNVTAADRYPFRFDFLSASMTKVPLPPAARGGVAYAVNRRGEIAGSFETSDGDRPFVTGANGAGPIDLGTFGGIEGWANAINARGQAVGSAFDKKGVAHGFVTDPDDGQRKLAYVDPDGRSVNMLAINDRGLAVGYDYGIIPFHQYRAVAAAPGGLALHVLDDFIRIPGVSLMFATGVNRSGQIVALGSDNCVYLLSPVRRRRGPQ